jgi:peptidoglycan/xylan/chitin deacetylase (PgdA/CDA1 family)
MSLKLTAARTLWALAHVSGFSRTRARSLREARVLMLHDVGGASYPAGVFTRQMAYLRRNFQVVPLERLLHSVSRAHATEGVGGEIASPTRDSAQKTERSTDGIGEVALTFDDGLRNNFTVVYPILRSLNLPATFYLCPDLIETGRWLWNREARERLRSLSVAERSALFRRTEAEGRTVEGVVEWMKSLGLSERLAVEEQIRGASSAFHPNQAQHEAFDLMRWDDVRALQPELITIGSHTRSHPILSRLSEGELAREVVGSREELERRLGRPVEHFCYPNGDRDPRVVQLVRHTYSSAVTVLSGFVRRGADPFLLPRIPMPRNLAALAWRLHKPDGGRYPMG